MLQLGIMRICLMLIEQSIICKAENNIKKRSLFYPFLVIPIFKSLKTSQTSST